MNKALLKKESREMSAPKREKKKIHGIPFLQNGEEVSRQFEWLKKRNDFITNPETAQAYATWNMERLKQAIEKLKAAREEIHKAFLTALKMKTAGDEVADEFMSSMADLAKYTNDEFYANKALPCPRKDKNLYVCRIKTPDGEIHYVHQEFKINEPSANGEDFGKMEVKKTMKKDAAKPLFLRRED